MENILECTSKAYTTRKSRQCSLEVERKDAENRLENDPQEKEKDADKTPAVQMDN